MRQIDKTHDPQRTSWVESAADPQTDFPIQNLPFCVFRPDPRHPLHIGVGIGAEILDLTWCARKGLLPEASAESCNAGQLNPLMALSVADRVALRYRISTLLAADCKELQLHPQVKSALVAQKQAEFFIPCTIGDYTDFYASVFHATNVGSMFRPDNPLLPNYKYIPIGYHGRGSSIAVSGQRVRRPIGQLPPSSDGEPPGFGPCRNLDYELEVGCFIAEGNSLGEPVKLSDAESRMFGLCLVNDWSARDIQRWEYQPLGPFLAKSFATTISPWVVTLEALEPFRCTAYERPKDDPQPLDYLDSQSNRQRGGFHLQLEVLLSTEKMRSELKPPQRLSSGTFADMYWTFAQMVTHHSSNGCNLNPGDLLASGTVSNRDRSSRGCLLELTWDGEIGAPVPGSQRTPVSLSNGEQRTFLQDGDEVILRGWCEADGFRRIGLGECRGTIEPSPT